MFRDDLKAAQARAEQLERELAEAEGRAERGEEEIAGLRELNEEQELEIGRLRKALGLVDPKKRGPALVKKTWFSIVGVVSLFAIAIGVWGTISTTRGPEQREAIAVKAGKDPGVVGPAEAMSFSEFVRHVSERCNVTKSGYVASCRPKGLRDELKRAEARVGSQVAMLTYCRLVGSEEAGGASRRLAAHRMRSTYGKSLESVDAKVYKCLDEVLQRAGDKTSKTFDSVVYTWARLGAKHAQRDAVLARIEGLPESARAEAYKGLWRIWRLDALPLVQPLLYSHDLEVVDSALQSLSYLRNEKERRAVCPLLTRVLKKQRGSAKAKVAYRAALICRGRANDEIFAAAREAIDGPEKLDFWWVSALKNTIRYPKSANPSHRKEASELLARIVEEDEQRSFRRAQALRELAKIDEVAAKELAQRYLKKGPARLQRAAKLLVD